MTKKSKVVTKVYKEADLDNVIGQVSKDAGSLQQKIHNVAVSIIKVWHDAKGDADHRKQCPEVVFLTRLLGERQTGGHTAITATTTQVEVPADVAEQAQGGRSGVVDHLSKPDVGSHQRVTVACRVVRFVPMAVAGARFKGVRRKEFGVGPAVGVDALGAVPKQVAAFQLGSKCGGVIGVAEDG